MSTDGCKDAEDNDLVRKILGRCKFIVYSHELIVYPSPFWLGTGPLSFMCYVVIALTMANTKTLNIV